MRYAKVNESIWMDEKFANVTDSAKLLYIYLLSCSKCNSVGIFQIGLGSIEDEFGHERADIKAYLKELEGEELLKTDKGWMWFNRYLKWNEPTSPNHARHCAADLNECVMRGAPKEAVMSFLSSVKAVMGNQWMQKQTEDGKRRSYLEEFKSNLDQVLVGEYVGGVEVLRKCVDEGRTAGSSRTNRSTPNNIGSTSNSTGSTPNNIDTNTITITRQLQDKTKQDNTRSCLSCEIEEPSEVFVICSDSQPHALRQASVRLALDRLGDGYDSFINRVQKATMMVRIARPEPSDLDTWFVGQLENAQGGDA